MSLAFEVVGAEPDRYAAVPTLVFRLRITETDRQPVHAIALRAQVKIEPQRRTYAPAEEERLLELFGETPRWGDTLRPFLWLHASTMVSAFSGSTEVDLPVACTYDFEVAGAKYLHALDSGEAPLLLLFNGTAFRQQGTSFQAVPLSWESEAPFRMPATTWRQMMDLYFPNSGWVRLRRETLDDLQRFRVKQALPNWDQAIEALLKEEA